jgi:hypothetical protein
MRRKKRNRAERKGVVEDLRNRGGWGPFFYFSLSLSLWDCRRASAAHGMMVESHGTCLTGRKPLDDICPGSGIFQAELEIPLLVDMF